MFRFNLIYTTKYNPIIFDEYSWNMHETKSSDKRSQLFLGGEQPKSNVDEGDISLI